jgi:hypothetical protein
LALEVRFGAEGLELIPEISQISDLELLKNIYSERSFNCKYSQ